MAPTPCMPGRTVRCFACIAAAMSSTDSPGGGSPLLAVAARGSQEPELLHCCRKEDGTALELLWRANDDGIALLG